MTLEGNVHGLDKGVVCSSLGLHEKQDLFLVLVNPTHMRLI